MSSSAFGGFGFHFFKFKTLRVNERKGKETTSLFFSSPEKHRTRYFVRKTKKNPVKLAMAIILCFLPFFGL
jgi:hypothetical protein